MIHSSRAHTRTYTCTSTGTSTLMYDFVMHQYEWSAANNIIWCEANKHKNVLCSDSSSPSSSLFIYVYLDAVRVELNEKTNVFEHFRRMSNNTNMKKKLRLSLWSYCHFHGDDHRVLLYGWISEVIDIHHKMYTSLKYL